MFNSRMLKISKSCEEKTHCINCHNHFMELRPSIKEVVVSKHFRRDVKDEKMVSAIASEILSCESFAELHKFEEHVDGIPVFRAKKDKIHFVFAVEGETLVLLRAFKNFKEYEKFLEDKTQVKKLL